MRGTASKAREIQRGPFCPQPLGSNACPEGLPDLSARDHERVHLANRLYEYACDLFLAASRQGILATLQNPKNSFFWPKLFLFLMKEM